MSGGKLCVVLLNYANWRDTLECLESLTRATHEDLAVVVVDSGSPDDSLERLRDWVESGADARPPNEVWDRLPQRPRQRPAACEIVPPETTSPPARDLPPLDRALTICPSPRRLGFAAGCNAGIRLALADDAVRWIWLLNNDAVAAPDAAARLSARAAGTDRLGALGTLIADYREPGRIQILGGGRVAPFSAEALFPGNGRPIEAATELAPAVTDLDYISGASLFTSAEAVRRIGFLDETMHLYWEDTDWGARARAAGRCLEVCAEAVVWHKGQASTGGINHYTKFHNFRSATVYLRRHRRGWAAPLAVRLGKSVVRDLLTLRPRDAAAALGGLAAGIRAGRGAPVPAPPDPA